MPTPETPMLETFPTARPRAANAVTLKGLTWPDICAVTAKMRDHDRRDLCGRSATNDPVQAVQPLLGTRYVGASLWRDGEPVAVMGAVCVAVGAAGLFHFATDRWPEVAVDAVRFVAGTLLPSLREAGITRIHAVTLADEPQEAEWLRETGAKEVGRLEGRGKNGEHYVRYAYDGDVASAVSVKTAEQRP